MKVSLRRAKGDTVYLFMMWEHGELNVKGLTMLIMMLDSIEGTQRIEEKVRTIC